MSRTISATLIVLLLGVAGGADQASRSVPDRAPRPEDFADVLSMTGRPARVDDWPASRFADLGAWFGYLLPLDLDASLRGAFVGPFLTNEGRWAGITLAQVQLEDDSGRLIATGAATDFKTTVYPGWLRQGFTADGFAVALDLVFVSGRSAVVRATVVNAGARLNERTP